MESLFKNTPNKGTIENTALKGHLWRLQNGLSYGSNTFSHLKNGQPLYSGQISWSLCVLCTLYTLFDFTCKDLGFDNHICLQPQTIVWPPHFLNASDISGMKLYIFITLEANISPYHIVYYHLVSTCIL